MAKITKRFKAIQGQVDLKQQYTLEEALAKLTGLPEIKFTESIDLDINLDIDIRQSDQQIRGTCALPNGSGRTIRVAVFARDQLAKVAKDAGADIVGAEDLAEQIEAGKIDFDRCIASPDMMAIVGKLGRILGPRNLMPNPKLGTVTQDVAGAVQQAKAGSIQLRADRGGSIHASIGRKNFDHKALLENISSVFSTLIQLKPAAIKGRFVKQVFLTSTMGPGLQVDLASLATATKLKLA